jgi:hypothetical protein
MRKIGAARKFSGRIQPKFLRVAPNFRVTVPAHADATDIRNVTGIACDAPTWAGCAANAHHQGRPRSGD